MEHGSPPSASSDRQAPADDYRAGMLAVNCITSRSPVDVLRRGTNIGESRLCAVSAYH
jgi:hypothetical protein